jgi:hypothetical protein
MLQLVVDFSNTQGMMMAAFTKRKKKTRKIYDKAGGGDSNIQ